MSLTSFLGMGIPRHVVTVEPKVADDNMASPSSPTVDTASETLDQFECREDQHLLVAMKSIGKTCIPSGCHGGGCGVCKIKIQSGDVERLVMSRKHVSESEEQEGYALACRIFPRSPVKLRVVGKTAVVQ